MCVNICVYVCKTCNYARVIVYTFDVRCICKCVFVCVSACKHEGMYAMYVCMYVYVCICMRICICM